MVIPVGRRSDEQELLLVVKRPDGGCRSAPVISVRFVPLTGPGARGRGSQVQWLRWSAESTVVCRNRQHSMLDKPNVAA